MRCVACNQKLNAHTIDDKYELCNPCLRTIRDDIPFFIPEQYKDEGEDNE